GWVTRSAWGCCEVVPANLRDALSLGGGQRRLARHLEARLLGGIPWSRTTRCRLPWEPSVSGEVINYRAEPTDTAAALIDRELAARLGSDRVFLDGQSIPAGADAEELLGRLRACNVLVVVIGPRWLTLTDAAGRRRIDDPHDWIRREIPEALS